MPLYNPSPTQSKNELINGDFRISQRGNSFPLNTSAYTADRWVWNTLPDGGTVADGTISFVNFGAGETLGGLTTGLNRRHAQVSNTSIGSNLGINSQSSFLQRILDVDRFNGEIVTLSFFARSTIPNKRIAAEITQIFGSGGSTGEVVSPVSSRFVTLSSDWGQYWFSFQMPANAGKTLGTNHHLVIRIYLQAGSGLDARTGQTGGLPWGGTGSILFTRIQLERSNTASEFEMRSLALEQALCNYFYQRISIGGRFFASGANQYFSIGLAFPRMRVTPAAIKVSNGVRGNLLAEPTLGINSPASGRLEIISGAAGDTYVLEEPWALDAEL